MWGAVIVMTPFEGAVRGSLEGSRDGRVYVYNHDELGDRATPLCGTQLGVLSQLNAVALGEAESMRLIERLKEEVEGSADEQRVAQV
jgi:hypothetical protein